MSESKSDTNVVCVITPGVAGMGPLQNAEALKRCLAGKHWCGEWPDSLSLTRLHYFIPPAGSPSCQVTVYSEDKSAIITSTITGDVTIVRDVRRWVWHEFSCPDSASDFAGKAWDLATSRREPSLPLVCSVRKNLLIYCMGENKAKAWFKEHRGIVARPWFILEEHVMDSLLTCLHEVCDELPMTESTRSDPEWVGHDVERCIRTLEGLKPHVPAEKP